MNQEKAKAYQRFFKTGAGEYGEGDIFLGLSVPESRAIAKKFTHLTLEEIKHLPENKAYSKTKKS